jgi:hypothetical protein
MSVLNVFVMAAKVGTNRGVALADAGCWMRDNYGLRITDYKIIPESDLFRYFAISLFRNLFLVTRNKEK